MPEQEKNDIFSDHPAPPPPPPRPDQEIRPKLGQPEPEQMADPKAETIELLKQIAADVKRAADALVYACREQVQMLDAHRKASKAIMEAQTQAQNAGRQYGPNAAPY